MIVGVNPERERPTRKPFEAGLVAVFLAAWFLGAGCTTLRERRALPADRQTLVQIRELPEVRAWGDELSPRFQRDFIESFRQERVARLEAGLSVQPETYDLLAISGGAGDGAYGAGLLCGWTKAGTRPRFKLVTGVSTGALMSPFAFLGPEYDSRLSEVYTNITSRNIFTFGICDAFRMFYRDYVANTRPLRMLAERCYDAELLEKVAVEHRRGRRLYVGTTSLDAQRPVIWDMGAIAASGHPRKLELFREVILASAAIPVIFPPVYLPVEAGGETYDEMHVDGGVIAQVFVCGAVLDPVAALREATAGPAHPKVRFFVIRNSHITPDWQEVRPRLTTIAKRSVATLTKAGGASDVARIYEFAQENGADFNLAFIPADIQLERKDEFDRAAMNLLYARGFEQAEADYPWQKEFRFLSPSRLPREAPPGGNAGGAAR